MPPCQQSDSDSDVRRMLDAASKLPAPADDRENLVVNSRGTITPWEYTAPSASCSANSRVTVDGGNTGVAKERALDTLPVSGLPSQHLYNSSV